MINDDLYNIRSTEDIEAIEKIPLEERLKFDNTYDLLRDAAEQHPDHPAIHFQLTGDPKAPCFTQTYRETFTKITQAANLFHAHGVGATDVVSFVLPNLPQTHELLWGGEAAGITNAINPLLEPDQMAHIMNAAGTKVLVTIGPFPKTDIWEKVDQIIHKIPTLNAVFRIDMGQFLPFWQKAVVKVMNSTSSGNGNGQHKVTVLDYDRERDQQPGDRLVSGRRIKGSDIASYFHTGGTTTGMPKLAQHTHFMEAFEAFVLRHGLELDETKCLIAALPLFHVNGVVVTSLAPLTCGSSIAMLTPAGFRGEGVIPNFWKLVERYKASFFSGVPTVYTALLNVPLDGADISSLEYALCGAAPMPPEVFRKFEEYSGMKILEGYGLTEGTCVSSFNPPKGERRIGSIGVRLPYQQMKTVILDENGNYVRDCGVDEIGNVCIKGPNVFPGYKEEHRNAGAFVADGWLNTGDLGRMDKDGYCWLTGRAKDLIIRGGHNIDPGMIEDAMHKHEAVALAAAVGQPDAYAGELPVVYVTLKPDAKATEEELKAHARESIPERAAVPVRVEIIETMPVTAVGKVFKPDLRILCTTTVLQEALEKEGVEAKVEVKRDNTHGTKAWITVGSDEDKTRADKMMAGYTVPFEVLVKKPAPEGVAAKA